MGINGSDCPLVATAREVNELLAELKATLDTSMSPQRVAMRQLGVDGMGWTSTIYADDAFKLWSDMLRRNPHDLETLHHLAIMHHARAIDREGGKRPSEADADWTAALGYWTRLWQSDGFWDGIAAAACKGAKRDVVDALRRRFPEMLLTIHFDIAFDSRTQPHRSKYHLRLVDASELPAECKDKVRRETYNDLLKGVPNSVWLPDVLDPAVIRQGTEVVERYLNLDPGCLPALEDALRLQVRLLRAHYTDLQAAGDDSAERRSLLQAFLADAIKWRPYFEQLVPVTDQTAEDVQPKLCLWCRVMGEVHRRSTRTPRRSRTSSWAPRRVATTTNNAAAPGRSARPMPTSPAKWPRPGPPRHGPFPTRSAASPDCPPGAAAPGQRLQFPPRIRHGRGPLPPRARVRVRRGRPRRLRRVPGGAGATPGHAGHRGQDAAQ